MSRRSCRGCFRAPRTRWLCTLHAAACTEMSASAAGRGRRRIMKTVATAVPPKNLRARLDSGINTPSAPMRHVCLRSSREACSAAGSSRASPPRFPRKTDSLCRNFTVPAAQALRVRQLRPTCSHRAELAPSTPSASGQAATVSPCLVPAAWQGGWGGRCDPSCTRLRLQPNERRQIEHTQLAPFVDHRRTASRAAPGDQPRWDVAASRILARDCAVFDAQRSLSHGDCSSERAINVRSTSAMAARTSASSHS